MSFTAIKDSDNYATDKIGWEIINKFIPKDKQIWCPFYCDGKQKEYMKELGHNVIHNDEDFFTTTPDYDVIIDNPPFSCFKEICAKLKDLDKPFIVMCFSKVMLMKWFQKLFKEHLQVIIPFKRRTFTHLTHTKKNYTPPHGVMYFCYKMNLDKDLIFI